MSCNLKSSRARLRAASSLAVATLFCGTSSALAGDVQVQGVAKGRATFERSGANTIIRAADRTVINYSRFNVPRGTSVQFIQPSAASRVLNRVNSAAPSKIDGAIRANGRVYLMNPAGVVFGADSSVKAAGFYAGAANISDDDFLAGINRFTLGPGEAINEGHIEADVVGLLGRHVANRGTIVTPAGEGGLVAMAAGDGEVMIGEQGGNILVKLDSAAAGAPSEPSRPGVENTGRIHAAKGHVTLAAGDIYSLAIRQTPSGEVKAKSVTVQGDDRGGIVQVGGKIDVTNDAGNGGSVQILGDRIALTGATIDASGETGGGTILVGGEYKGGGDVPTASATFASANTTLRADATHNGDGGRVIVWSDDSTRFLGAIAARGGAHGGNGGFVETSGSYLDIGTARVDVAATNGTGGQWLLDPSDIFIESDVIIDAILADPTLTQQFIDAGFEFSTIPGNGLFAPTTPRSVIRNSQISNALNNGTSVTLDATAGPGLLQENPGDIFVDAPIIKSIAAPGETTPTLTLIGPKGITVSKASAPNDNGTPDDISDDFVNDQFPGGAIIVTAGKLNVVLQSEDLAPAALGGVIPDAAGDISLFGPVITNGGNFTATVNLSSGPFRPLGGTALQFAAEAELSPRTLPIGAPPSSGPDTRVVVPFLGGVIDTRAGGGEVGGNVAISVPRRITVIAPIFTGGGSVQMSSVGSFAEESSVVVARPIDTSAAGGGAGGNVSLQSSGNVRVRQILTASSATSPGGTISLLADFDNNGSGSFELLPTITSISASAVDPADPTILVPLDAPVTSMLEAGTAAITIQASESTVLAGDVHSGSLTVTADAAPGGDGIFSQLAGFIDTGTGPIDITGNSLLLAGTGIRGGRQTYGASTAGLTPNIVIVPGENGYTIESTTAEGVTFNGNVVVTDQPGEDINGNGVLDVGEDINSNRIVDPSEDLDGDGRLDTDETESINQEDLNGNGIVDVTDSDLNGNGQLDLNEDANFNRMLDPGEDANGNGQLDTNEDVNFNSTLDPGEDLNGNGQLDTTEFDFNRNGVLDPAEDLNANGQRDAFEFDANGNGVLDLDEDSNGNGVLDRAEDLNGNGTLDFGEDFNGNNILDATGTGGSRVLRITTSGASSPDIMFNGTVGGAGQVNVEAGSGDVTFTRKVGAFGASDAPVQSLSVTGGNVTIGTAFSTGPITIDATRTQLTGENVQLTSGGDLTIRGALSDSLNGTKTATGDPVRIFVPDLAEIDDRLVRFDIRQADITTTQNTGSQTISGPRRAGVSVPSGLFFEAVQPSVGDAITVQTSTASASGFARTAAEVIAGANPQQRVQNVQSAGVAGSIAAELGKVGVFARELDQSESNEFLMLGRSFYDDASLRQRYRMVKPEEMMISDVIGTMVGYPVVPGLASTDVPPKQQPEELKVAANRIPYDEARNAVSSYQALMTDPVTGQMDEETRKTAIRESTTNTWLKYQEQAGDNATGAGYRAHIEAQAAEGDAEAMAALESLNQVRGTLRDVELLGLTPKELNNAKGVLLRDIRPIEETGMTSEIFEEAVRAGGTTRPAQ